MKTETIFGLSLFGLVLTVALVGLGSTFSEIHSTGLATSEDFLQEAHKQILNAQQEFRLTASFLAPAKIHAIVSPIIKAEFALKKAKEAFLNNNERSKIQDLETAQQNLKTAKDNLTRAGTISQRKRPPLIQEAKEQLTHAQEILENLK